MSKTITVEEGARAFEVTGLRPKPGTYGDEECGCLLTAMALERGYKLEGRNAGIDECLVKHGFRRPYLYGLTNGFDLTDKKTCWYEGDEGNRLYGEAFDVAAAVRARVLPVDVA